MDKDVMVGFGGKQAWLAVRAGEPAEVLAALGLRDLGTVTWRDGIDLAHLTDDRVAVTPPLPGARDTSWVLATGRRLIRPDAAVDVAGLSAALRTEVQFFLTHRVTELHRWQRAAELEEETTVLVSENDVLTVAGAWSIDPTTLTGRPAPGPLRIGAAS
jgi:hypothetical protein